MAVAKAPAAGAKPAKKKFFKEIAVVDADNCTGCDACVEVCPVDCIYKVPGAELPHLQSFVDIDVDRCIGCQLCAKWCPWDAIDMVPTEKLPEAVSKKGVLRVCALGSASSSAPAAKTRIASTATPAATQSSIRLS